MPTLGEIASAIEASAPLKLQESWDNTGWQVLIPGKDAQCTGVLTCVDASVAVIEEASALGFNMVVSHHPVMFNGQKTFTGATNVQRTVIEAIRRGISIYSCHTAIDSAPGGVSATIAGKLGLHDIIPLIPVAEYPGAGLGAVGNLPAPGLKPAELVELVKSAIKVPVTRCSRPIDPHARISRIALCGGSGSEFIPEAIAAGAEAYITGDTRYHTFVDNSADIFIIDIGHHEAECCTKEIFYHIITKFFPNFAVQSATVEENPIIYL